MKKSLGFTLIELLVVISIISLLSSIVLASVQDARDKAKGTKFRVEVEEFKKAIEMYRLDHNGSAFAGDPDIPYCIMFDGTLCVPNATLTIEDFNSPSIYISYFPKPPFPPDDSLFFWGKGSSGYLPGNEGIKCNGSDYYLLVTESKNAKFFSDWPVLEGGKYDEQPCFPISLN